MTLRQKIGQMLLMGFNGSVLEDSSPVAQWLSGDGLGGVILFDKDVATGVYGKNLKNQAQIKSLNQQLQHYSAESGHTPLLISIDYEGGAVDRLSKIEGCMPTIRPVDLAKLRDDDFMDEVTNMALTIKSLGFNLNFAPLVDLNLNDKEGIIGSLGRSFSSEPERVTHLARLFVDVFNMQGIACCYKHFPGHGSAVGDTHEGFVDVTETFNPDELKPYATLAHQAQDAVMVMTAHVINRHLDASGLPATLSRPILTGLLREQMGFDGVIISDDLQMHAIAKHYSLEESLRLTVNAGADMVIIANQLGYVSAPEVIDVVESLVLSGQIDIARIDEANRRIARLKEQMVGEAVRAI